MFQLKSPRRASVPGFWVFGTETPFMASMDQKRKLSLRRSEQQAEKQKNSSGLKSKLDSGHVELTKLNCSSPERAAGIFGECRSRNLAW